MWMRMLSVEWMKMRRSALWLLVLLGPCVALLAGGLNYLDSRLFYEAQPGDPWARMFSSVSMFYAMLFLPILAGIYAALVCRYEHADGGWKQLLALPVSKTQVFAAKSVVVAILMAVTQLLLTLLVIGFGLAVGVLGDVPWGYLAEHAAAGWLAALPLAALQMWVSTGWKSFAAPLALNVVLTLPAVLIANTATYGPWYPWAQPVLAMMPGDAFGDHLLSPTTFYPIVLGGLVVFVIGGWLSFLRRDVA
jgi:lantibiotic transport system permease protein